MTIFDMFVKKEYFFLFFLLFASHAFKAQAIKESSSGHANSSLLELVNQEARLQNTDGINKYIHTLVDLLRIEPQNIEYNNMVTNRLATAEKLTRSDKGKLISEVEIVDAFNNFVKKIGLDSNHYATLLSGYKLNRFSWLEKHAKSSWESIC